MDRDLTRGLNTQLDLIAIDRDDDDPDVVPDNDRLVDFAAQYEHSDGPPWQEGVFLRGEALLPVPMAYYSDEAVASGSAEALRGMGSRTE